MKLLETKQVVFFIKVAPVQSITDIALLGLSLILLPWMFISSYTTIVYFILHYYLFFRKEFLSNVYISVNTIFKCYLSFCLRNKPSIKYVRNWGNGGGSSKMWIGAYKGRGVSRLMWRTHWHYLFSCFCLMVSCFICRNLILPLFKKGACVQKWLFFSNEINFCYH